MIGELSLIDLKRLHAEFEADITSVTSWCEEIYQDTFSHFFTEGRQLFARLSNKEHPITDEELTWILIQLPIQLFGVAEALNKFKISFEVVKLSNKRRESLLIELSLETSASKKQQDASEKSLEDKLLATAYSTVIDRVYSENSFCRELIMGAKKIWDSRRHTDNSNPIGEVDPLPDYIQTPKPGGN